MLIIHRRTWTLNVVMHGRVFVVSAGGGSSGARQFTDAITHELARQFILNVQMILIACTSHIAPRKDPTERNFKKRKNNKTKNMHYTEDR